MCSCLLFNVCVRSVVGAGVRVGLWYVCVCVCVCVCGMCLFVVWLCVKCCVLFVCLVSFVCVCGCV